MFEELYEQCVGLHAQAVALHNQIAGLCADHPQFEDLRVQLSAIATIMGCVVTELNRLKNKP